MSYPTPPGGWPDPSSAQPGGPPADPYAPVAGEVLGPATSYPAGAYGAPANPAGYGSAPYPQYGYLPPPKTNGMAIAAMVVSITGALGLCAYGFGALAGAVGAVLGHVARRQIREKGESGDGMALAGIIVGWIIFGIGALIVGGFVVLVWTAIVFG